MVSSVQQNLKTITLDEELDFVAGPSIGICDNAFIDGLIFLGDVGQTQNGGHSYRVNSSIFQLHIINGSLNKVSIKCNSIVSEATFIPRDLGSNLGWLAVLCSK